MSFKHPFFSRSPFSGFALLRRSLIILLFSMQLSQAQGSLPTSASVEEVLRRANDYWIANNDVGLANWNRGAYQTGNYAAWSVLGETRYREHALLWATTHGWNLGRPYDGNKNHRLHADSQVAGQTYLDLYREEPFSERRAAVGVVMQELLEDVSWNDGRSDTVDNFAADDWWWVDAFYMSAPTLARLANIDDEEAYRTQIRLMYDWMKETRALYDPSEGLWYRDAASKSESSSGTNKVFWSRGNGWVMAGLARVLDELPPEHPDRAEYAGMLQTMAAALVPIQGDDGFWRSNLLDPDQYPNPETSGTAFFTAAMAWGLRNDILDSEIYTPIVIKAWNGLAQISLEANGRVGYIQNVGRAPAAATSSETHDFGMGAFLLAASEMLRLTGGGVPVLVRTGPNLFQAAGQGVHEASFTLDGSETVVFDGSITRASWWTGDTFLAEGLVADVILPGGAHPIILRIEHSSGRIFESFLVVTFGESGDAVDVASVSASTWQVPNQPDNIHDGDLETRWSAEGNGQWIQLDLGSVFPIASVDIAFFQGDARTSTFDVDFSTDGTTWQPILTRAVSSGSTLQLESFATLNQPARFIRYTGYGNSTSAWNSLTEMVLRQPARIVDSNDNGLPDVWESTRLGISSVDPDLDSDGDGYSNLEEFNAGTHPADNRDFPSFSGMVGLPNGKINLTFTSRAAFGLGHKPGASRLYQLESSPSLSAGSWTPVEGIGPITGHNLPTTVEVRPAFYRLRIELQP